MIHLALYLITATASAPADLSPFMDEPVAARAFEAHVSCLGRAGSDRSEDRREAGAVTAEIIQSCATTAASLRAAMIDVYDRRPALRGGESAQEAADSYLAGFDVRVAEIISEMRKSK